MYEMSIAVHLPNTPGFQRVYHFSIISSFISENYASIEVAFSAAGLDFDEKKEVIAILLVCSFKKYLLGFAQC